MRCRVGKIIRTLALSLNIFLMASVIWGAIILPQQPMRWAGCDKRVNQDPGRRDGSNGHCVAHRSRAATKLTTTDQVVPALTERHLSATVLDEHNGKRRSGDQMLSA